MEHREIQDVVECTLVSLIWEMESHDTAGRIVWRTGDARRSIGISAGDLSGIAATGVICLSTATEGKIHSSLTSADHDKIVRVLEMLQQMTFENKKIGVRSFRMTWVFA